MESVNPGNDPLNSGEEPKPFVNSENVNPHLNDPAHPLSDNNLQHQPPFFVNPVQPCPSCGHCPTCGRGGWNQGLVYYTWPNGTWVCGSGTTAMGTPNA